jgi:hypothetical protein
LQVFWTYLFCKTVSAHQEEAGELPHIAEPLLPGQESPEAKLHIV